MPENTEYFVCPVCGWPKLEVAPYDDFGGDSFDICPSCGTQFGYHDARRSHAELRERWIDAGMRWDDEREQKPDGWDPVAQLRAAGFAQ